MNDPDFAERPPIRFKPIDRQETISVQLDELLPLDHPVRIVVDFVSRLDFSPLHDVIKARAGRAGASAFRPELLFALWLFATIEGVAPSRHLQILCQRDLAYRWLCGGPAPSYHTLSSFYSDNGPFLDDSFIDILATLTADGLLEMKAITIDGRKVPADASTGSSHRRPTLEKHLAEARERVKAMTDERCKETAALSAKRRAAQKRAAEDKVQRLEAAVAEVIARSKAREATGRKDAKPEEARASETDADASKMKRAHGGYEMAYNVQTATEVESGLIVAVEVITQGCDNGQLLEMVELVEENLGSTPEQVLADAGYSSREDVQKLEERKIETLMPPRNERKEKKQGKDPYEKKHRDSKEIAIWRGRMGTEKARARYSRRAPVAEGVHAQQSNRGWKRFRLRGLVKARTEALWQAIVHNICVLMARKGRGVGTLRPKPA